MPSTRNKNRKHYALRAADSFTSPRPTWRYVSPAVPGRKAASFFLPVWGSFWFNTQIGQNLGAGTGPCKLRPIEQHCSPPRPTLAGGFFRQLRGENNDETHKRKTGKAPRQRRGLDLPAGRRQARQHSAGRSGVTDAMVSCGFEVLNSLSLPIQISISMASQFPPTSPTRPHVAASSYGGTFDGRTKDSSSSCGNGMWNCNWPA